MLTAIRDFLKRLFGKEPPAEVPCPGMFDVMHGRWLEQRSDKPAR